MRPLVSVLILNYKNPRATVECVSRLQAQTIAENIEIIVIDNHSNDDSIGILRNQLDGVRIVETPRNLGFGAGYNMGASYATGEYLLINNPDKFMPTDGIERLVEVISKSDEIGIVAPKLLHPDGTQRLSIRRFPRIIDVLSRRSILQTLYPTALRRYAMLDVDRSKQQDVDWVIGGCFLISKALFDQLDGFDERFFLFFEDTDLCKRVHETSKRVVYVPTVTVEDKKKRLSGERFFDLFFKKTGQIHILSACKYFLKWKHFL